MTRSAAVRLVAAGAVLAAAGVVPDAAAGTSTTTTVRYEDCRELTALVPAPGLGTALASIVFVCERVTVGQQPVGQAGVCEVLALQSDRSFRLLRTATDNRPLQQVLLRAGLPVARATHVDVTDASVPSASACTVLADDRTELTSSLTAAAVTASTAGSGLANGTLTHHHDDGGRRTTTTYANDLSGPAGAAGGGGALLDAGADGELTGWLGGEQAAGAVAAVRGDWTATVERG